MDSGIIIALIAIIAAIIGFFLRTLHSDLKHAISKTVDLKAKCAVLENDAKNKIDALSEKTELQLSTLTKSVDALTTTLSQYMQNSQDGVVSALKAISKKLEV